MTSLLYYIPVTVAVFATLIVAVIAFFQWRFGYWKRRGVKNPTPMIPFGNVFEMLSKQAAFGVHFKNMYNEFKFQNVRYFGCYFFARPTLVLTDPELIKTIMTKDFQHFTDHGNYVNEEVDPLTGNLFSLKGSKWKNLRVKLTPTFTSGKMKMMFQTLVDCSKGLIEVMDNAAEKREPLDIKDIVGRFTTDIIGSCAFGIECNSLKNPNSEFRTYGKMMFEIGFWQRLVRFLSITWPAVLNFFRISFFEKDMTNFFMNVVKQTVEYREENNIIRKDFMHLLIQLKNNITIKDEEHTGELKQQNDSNNAINGTGLNMDQLTAQAFVFFIAGFETSSTTLTFCFYELVTNRDIQEKLRDEINRTLEKHGGKITYDAIMEMTYMDRCIQETLRKYPPVPVLFRECTETYKIPDSDLTIDKGAQVFIPIMGIQYDEEHYPNPEKFDPERFSAENKSKRHPFTWLPFGEGPRACIGLRFGLMQTKVALAVLLRNYEFSLNLKTEMPMTIAADTAVLGIKGGLWLNAVKVTDL